MTDDTPDRARRQLNYAQIQRTEIRLHGGNVPSEVHAMLADGTLTGKELGVYLLIDSFKNGCWYTVKHLAERFKVKPRNMNYILAKLKRLGLVNDVDTVETRNGYQMRVLGTNRTENYMV